MAKRVLLSIFLLLALAAAGAAIVLADHPSPLPDTITTPNFNYNVQFTDDNPPPAADNHFFPTGQAQNIANGLDNGNAPTQGNPNGYHAGYTNRGFLAPDFAGAANPIVVFDCGDHGGCDNGNAPPDKINIPVPNWIGGTESCLRRVGGHELFHHVQYAYITFAKWSIWGTMPVEGTARMMEDKIFSDIDANACPRYVNQVNGYLGDPNQILWDASYSSALFWNYLTEQLGTIRDEPHIGVDVIRRFWENAQANNDSPDLVAMVRQTITQFSGSTTLEGIFLDFAIANFAKDLDVTALPNSTRYQYVDENDGTGQAYSQVATAWSGAIAPGSPRGPEADSVVSFGAQYFVAQPSADCRILGFKSEGDEAGYGLIAVTGADTAQRLYKGVGTSFARSLINRAGNPYTRLVGVVAGIPGEADFTYTFACGGAQLEIVRPTTSYKAFVGEPAAPERFLTVVNVTGPAELGSPSVEGLDIADFQVFVGAEDPANQAPILSGAYVQGSYWLVSQAPVKATDGDYPLLVKLADLATATKEGVVRYSKIRRDQVLVIDASGSMSVPAGNTKLEAAKNAGGLFVDASAEDDQLGVVRFSGDLNEPNNDATTLHQLQTVAGQRVAAKNQIAGIAPLNMTSIGDGLKEGQKELTARGLPEAEDFLILLSDGMENEADFWATIKPSILASGTVIHSIALGPETDQALMQEIATSTGGDYLYVDLAGASASAVAASDPAASGPDGSDLQAAGVTARVAPGALPLPNRLADVYRFVNEAIRRHQRLWESAGTVPAGGTTRLSIPVQERGLTEPIFSFNWAAGGTGATAELYRPDGSQVLAGQPGVRVFSDATHVVYQLDQLDPVGTWTAVLRTRAEVSYLASLSAKNVQGVQLDLYFGQAAYAQNQQFLRGLPMPILATLTDRRGPIRGAKVIAEIEHPDGRIDTLQLFDDGSHEDGNADDGIYAGLYTRTTAGSTVGVSETDKSTSPTRGSYLVRVTATGRSNAGEPFERVKAAAFQVFENDPSKKIGTEPDVDQDGLPDRWELLYPRCLSPRGADGTADPDGDGLSTAEEFRAGTNPCQADSDRGGESDQSELRRGANPLNARDDRIPVPIDVEVITWAHDHMPTPPLKPNTSLIRYPVSRAYQLVRLLRAERPDGPFQIVAEFDPRKFGGHYEDTGLVNGRTYFYRLVGVGLRGEVSAPGRVFSGTPKADPIPPVGHVIINDDRAFTESISVTLRLEVDGNDATEMLISNVPTFAGATWERFAPTKAWALRPDRTTGLAGVFVRYKDAAGNESRLYLDEIVVKAPGSLGSIRGQVVLPGQTNHAGVFVMATNHGQVTPVFTDASGAFTLSGLLPGSYDLRLERTGSRAELRTKIAVSAGGVANLGTVTLTGTGATPTATATRTPTPTPTPKPGGPPVLTGLRPANGANTGPVVLTVQGIRFQAGAQVALVGSSGNFGLTDATIRDQFTLEARVPPGVPTGLYGLRVTNPDGSAGLLPRAYTATGTRPLPQVVLPRRGLNVAPTEVTIRGFNFKPGMTVALRQGPTGGTVAGGLGAAAETTIVLTQTQQIDNGTIQAIIPPDLQTGTDDLVLIDPETLEEEILENAFNVLTPLNDDLFAAGDDLWTDPTALHTGMTVTLGLNLHRLGGKRTLEAPVAFYLGDPAQGGTLIGRATSVPIAPRTELETVTIPWALGSLEGGFEIYAVIDPDNTFAETTKENNVAVRAVTILPRLPDMTPPDLTNLVLDGGASQSTSGVLSVDLSAIDRESRVASLYLVEREFNSSARGWIPISATNWVSFTSPYQLTLTSRPGVKYVQAWVADAAGNISLNVFKQRIDYVAPTDNLRIDQVRVYRRTLAAGVRLSARLVPVSGDADLYIWDPNGNSVLVRNAGGTAVDEGAITAAVAGTYQVEVFAASDTVYRLTIGGGAGASFAGSAPVGLAPSQEKAQRTEPVIPSSEEPEDRRGLPVAPISMTAEPDGTPPAAAFRAYLPAVKRSDSSGW